MFYPRAVAPVVGDVQSHGVFDLKWCAVEGRAESYSFVMFEQTPIFSSLALRAPALLPSWTTLPALAVPILKLTRAFEIMTVYKGLDLPIFGSLPQFAPENTASLKRLCL